MYLQSLELVGFKSFVQKTQLEFTRGVTAIVGPNGCGKSNILDAIRWVLGEQSAKALRGGEMADVIFSGTESRQALGMAEVSMTFAECEKDLGVEWNEVRVTRRVFRDGRSEYFLNKSACRLKDIHQLFMDTGIGRSAYSIMEQGKLDQILSSRPEDRRTIFEEAAGITKYKSQKREALRKLEHTETNLLRLADILKEVKRQIGSLQRQAAKARRFQSLMRDLRIFDTHLSHRNYQALQMEWEESRSRLESYEESRRAHAGEIERKEADLAAFRVRQEEIDLRISSQREQMQNLKNRIFSGEQRIETHSQRKTEFVELINRDRAEIESAAKKLQEQESQIVETDRLIRDLLAELGNKQQELNEREGSAQKLREKRVSTERTLQAATSKNIQLERNISRLRAEISTAESKRNALHIRNEMLVSEEGLTRQRLESAQQKLEVLQDTLADMENAVTQAKQDTAEAELQMQEAQRLRREKELQVQAKNKALAELESRFKVLSELHASGEGFDEGTQAVLRGLDQPDFFKPAILGALASLIEVVPEHIRAIESVLGSALETILIKDVSFAELLLAGLTAKELGRASLAPRSWITALSPWEKPPLPSGALSWALDSIRCSQDFYPLLAYLLANVALVPHPEIAFQLKEEYPDYGFVTPEGEFLSCAGIATGGRARQASSSTLIRRAQMADLEKNIALASSESEAIAAEHAHTIASSESTRVFFEECRESVQQRQLEHSRTQSELSIEQREMRNASDKVTNISKEINELAVHAQRAQEQQTNLESALKDLLTQVEEMREAESNLQVQLEEERQRESNAFDDLQDLRIRVATENQRQEALLRQRQPMASRLSELNEILEKRKKEILSYENRINSLENETIELRQSIAGWQEEQREVETQLAEFGTERREVHETVELLESTLRTARKQLTDLQDQQGQLEVRSSELKMRSEHLCEHLRKRYQIALPEFQPDSYALICALKERSKSEEKVATDVQEPEISWSQVEDLVKELTERIESVGPVNLEAIQEFDELEQRHGFLEQQNHDLIASKAELLEVISKINQTTKELFSETFEKIRLNFQEMFIELFGGGKANLLLANESDPLESGIEISAKPPGKQLQSISLLSGGERTMTAVSLLFAIYMVKPSPFCVLDEMDAPLDESNINRFIKILDRFIEQSQFVVITHNKRTIGRADTLYGVTMEEHGVSKLVSVQFRSKDTARTNTPSVAETFGKDSNLHSEQQELIATN
ncbi:MAG: chromosome segregation protein SMC [Verrucomicrobia bacterium]|nr:MAG: chromosome segregation protein SMC [Verrucomicrobiota bacterium]